MFKNLIKNLNELIESRRESRKERLKSFDDPFVYEVDWTPLRNGGANFRIRSFHMSGNGDIKFLASWMVIVFCLAFIVMGFMLTHLFLSPSTPLGQYFLHPLQSLQFWYWALRSQPVSLGWAGPLFLFIGLVGVYKIGRPNRFDLKSKQYQFGYPWFRKVVPFEKIKAIQIIAEHQRHNRTNYLSYELNIVLTDKTRINVTDHNDAVDIRAGAKAIAEAVSVPVWDFTDPTL